jgi:membrane fusion protein, heavy metal efflux system
MPNRPGKPLSKTALTVIVTLIACFVLIIAFVVVPIVRPRHSANVMAATPTPAPPPKGFFRLTDQEWSSLEIARVDEIPFPSVAETEGTIAAADDTTTQVFSNYTGRVTGVFATVGDTVQKGSPLFSVNGSEYAQAANDLVTAIETLRTARIQLGVTSANRNRLLALQKVDGAAAKDVEQSSADLATAQTAVQNGNTAVALVRSRLRVLGVSDQDINHLAKVGRGAILPTGVVVPAPISGIVTQRGVGIGQNVDSAANGASDPLFTITDVSRVFFVANVPETSIAAIHAGDPVSVKMLAFPGRTFDAQVKYIAPTVDPNTHRIFVRSEVANPEGTLKPGMFGTMRISTGPASPTISVPEDAVIFEENTARVWITGPDKTLALRYVHAGKTVDGRVQVLAGLQAGQSIVTSGSIFIDRALRGGD